MGGGWRRGMWVDGFFEFGLRVGMEVMSILRCWQETKVNLKGIVSHGNCLDVVLVAVIYSRHCKPPWFKAFSLPFLPFLSLISIVNLSYISNLSLSLLR